MQLTIQTDYALRTLMYLASRDDRATVAEVAALFDISANHVAKVVNQLSRFGYIRSVRGLGGGIELAVPLDEIRLGEVIERFEGNLHLLECVGTEGVCVIQPFCKLKGVLAEAERLQREYLNSVTLADVAPSRRQLKQVTQVESVFPTMSTPFMRWDQTMQTGRRKRLSLKFMLQAGILLVILSSLFLLLEEVPAEESQQKIDPPRQMYYPTTAVEARVRARILHETVHGALQVMHRDFFEEEESRVIPSHSLEDVFKELERSQGIKVRWLAVNARAMNVDNEPRTEFEKQAVKVLSSGKAEFEQITDKEYQFTGSIRLASQCLKCHLPMRKSNEARVAGLVISMPLKVAEKEK